MTRAEEAATKAYGGVPQLRQAFLHGYEQAEEDLALTWEDIQLIIKISDRLIMLMADRIKWNNLASEQEYYEEVLRRFNETKQSTL